MIVMSSRKRPARISRILTAGVGAGIVVMWAAAPSAAADPGAPLAPNCMSGTGGVTYCDTDVTADGSWSRCSQPESGAIYVFGGAVADAPLGAQTCQTVTAASVPAGSPPHHIGYGGEATGRM